MKKPLKDITTICPWCKMGLEIEELKKLMAKAIKETRKIKRKTR